MDSITSPKVTTTKGEGKGKGVGVHFFTYSTSKVKGHASNSRMGTKKIDKQINY